MKKYIIILAVLISTNIFAQKSNDAVVSFSGGVMNLKNVPALETRTVGSVYLYEEWNNASFSLFDGRVVKDLPVKYDLRSQRIEIKYEDDLKVLPVDLIKEIYIFNSLTGEVEHLLNCTNFSYDKKGFYHIVYNGKKTLMKKIELELLDGNYNTIMNVGSKDSRYTKRTEYYYAENGKVKKIRKGKKNILNILEDKKDIIANYAKDNKLKYNSDDDLKKIFNYYDSL